MKRLLTPTTALLLLIPALPTHAITVRGQVLGPGDAPLVDASVRLQSANRSLAVVSGKTTADGLFQLPASPPGPHLLRVEAPDLVAIERTLPPVLEDRGVPPAHLAPGRPLTVSVQAPDGSPVPQATLTLSPTPAPDAGRWYSARLSARTGATGRAELPAVAETALRLEITAAGHPPWFQTVQPGAHRISARLAPGRTVVLEIVDPQGAPAGGVTVRLADGRALGETDEGGRLEAVLPTADVTLYASTDDGSWAQAPAPFTTVAKRPVQGEEQVGRNLNMRLKRPRWIEGRVVRRTDGLPVAGAWVWSPQNAASAVRSDAKGSFSLPAAPFVDHPLVAAAAVGYRSNRASDEGHGTAVIALTSAASLHGQLLDTSGQPVPGAAMNAATAYVAARDTELATWTWSDNEGRFRLSGLPPGTEMWLRVRRPGWLPLLQTIGLPTPGDSGPLKLVLQPSLRAIGRVANRDGLPVARATVHLQPSDPADPSTGLLTAAEHRLSATTDRTGRFIVDDLGPGRVDVQISAPGLAPLRVPGIVASPDRPGLADLGSFVLEPAAVLQGRVASTDGEPLPDVRVTARQAGAPSTSVVALPPSNTVSGRTGEFTVSELVPDRTYVLRLQRTGYTTVVLSGIETPQVAPIEVRMEPATVLHGRVVDDRGEPLPEARVVAVRMVDGRERPDGLTTSDPQGRFTLVGLAAGRLRVTVQADGFATAESAVLELLPGEDRDPLEIELSRGGSLTGTVRNEDGEPLDGIRLLAAPRVPRGLPVPLQTTSSENGSFQLNGLNSGRWTLTALHPSYRRLQRELDVSEGEQRLDLTLQRGGEVSGRVVDAAGELAAGVEVRLSPLPNGPAPAPVATTAEGLFRFAGTAFGRHRLYAARGEATAVRVIEVTEVPETNLELRLDAGASVAGRVLGLKPHVWRQTRVTASTSGLPSRSTGVAHDGSYDLRGLPPGTWDLTVQTGTPSPSAKRQIRIAAGKDLAGIDLEMDAGFQLTGRVRVGGQPTAGILVSVQGNAGAAGGDRTDSEGFFSLSRVPPGSYLLVALDPATGARHAIEVTVEEDRDVSLDLGESAAP